MRKMLIAGAVVLGALMIWPGIPLARFYGPFIAAYLFDHDSKRAP